MIERFKGVIRAIGRSAAALTLALTIGAWPASAPVRAQSVVNSFAGFSSSSNEPIDIESDTLEVRDAEKTAIFSGNVKAVQGGMTLRSRELMVHYTGESTDGAGLTAGGGTEINKISAKGKVLINTDQQQTATSEWALFEVTSQLVTIGGNVVLTQGENVIKGDRLVIDLKTGRSRFENENESWAPRQRVRGLFRPGGGGETNAADDGAGQDGGGQSQRSAAPAN